MKRIKPGISSLRILITAGLLGCILSLSFFIPQTTGISLATESSNSSDTADLDPSIDFVQIGLTGSITTNIEIAQLAGKKAVLLGTSKGLYIISEGDLLNYIATPGSVTNITLMDDISGDGEPEIVITLDDTRFPNIRCYNGISGEKIWDFASSQEAFLDNILWTEIETATFDVTVISDVNSDSNPDIAATSGYGLYVLNGKTGEQLWRFDAENNLWQVAEIPDISGDDVKDLAVGSQTGFIHVLDGASGKIIWEKRISEKTAVYDESGEKWATVDTSVWDILPVEIHGKQMALVSSEDARVRLIDLDDGTSEWETSPLIEYNASLLFTYYQQKSKLPTSPGDDNFFNLRIFLTDDISDDGIGDIIASTYAGQSGQQGTSSVNSGLYMLDTASGNLIWSNNESSLSGTAEIETASIDEEQVILLPQEKSGTTMEINFVEQEEGTLLKTLEITVPQSSGSDGYWTRELEADSFITANSYDDLLCISSEGKVQWYYPRISDVVVETGEFTGDNTEDLFIWSKHRISDNGDKYGTRILYVVDGATRSKAWSYVLSYDDLEDIQGITGIMVTPDLDGDQKQDIVGYTVPQTSGNYGEGYKIVAFSGEDGDLIINQPVVSGTYYGLYDQLYEAKADENLDTTLDTILADGVHDTYYDIYSGLDNNPILKSQVDYFVNKILTDNSGDYNTSWPDDPDWMDNLEQNLNDNQQNRKINKRIFSLDLIDIKGEPAIVVSCQQDMFILDSDGSLLWIGAYNASYYQDPFTYIQPNEWQIENQGEALIFSPGDINNDDVDDLVFASWGSIDVLTSNYDSTSNSLSFIKSLSPLFKQEGTQNTDRNYITLVDDIDTDGIKEVFFPINDDQTSIYKVVSPKTGNVIIEGIWQWGGQSSIASSSADFNNDGFLDRIVYSSWNEQLKRPVLQIISGKNSSIIWEYDGYQNSWVLQNLYGLTQLTPATAISDMTGDGIPEIALTRFQTRKDGSVVDIYDVVNDELVKEIAIEAIDTNNRWDDSWHPGIAIEETGDFNGDGTNELAMVTLLTESDSDDSDDSGENEGENKEIWLMVVDVANEEAVAEFQIMTTQFIDTNNEKEMVVVGVNGEVYFLNMDSDFHITAPETGSSNSSPLTISWEGVPQGSYYQIYIDDAEVARTNDNQISLDVSRGEHKLVVRSMDAYGRGLYTSITFTVNKSTSIVIFASIGLVLSLLVATYPHWFRLISSRRKESVNEQ